LSTAANAAPAAVGAQAVDAAMLPAAHSAVAAMPDRGSFLEYATQAPIRRGAAIWHPVQMSEAHALAAIADGGMVIDTPDGTPVRLQYVRHVEHPDGNWTWIGRPAGSGTGRETILTFGPKAVFGSIAVGDDTLDITTSGGRTWMVATDQRVAADERYAAATKFTSDALKSPVPVSSSTVATAAPRASAAPASVSESLTATSSNAVVDLVMGYTSGFAARLGGTSQAVTRLNFMVDIANQAYANSRVSGRVRLVHTVEVNYPDATLNRTALFELSGLNCSTTGSGTLHLPDTDANCTAGTVPSALKPLITAGATYGADLVSLVRMYQVPENQSCGVSWLIGGGGQAIVGADRKYALSVISDTSGSQFPDDGNTCRNETLAHEMGHNMGLAHDPDAAAGSDDSDGDNNPLDPNEYGRYSYSFGYSTDSSKGNFYTIMAIPVPGQRSVRLFSNPDISDCEGFPCGVAAQDNARTLSQTMPLVAAFRAPRVQSAGVGLQGDYNGDGKADIFWRNYTTGGNTIWRSGSKAQRVSLKVVSTGWVAAAAGDFNGDGKDDVLWRESTTGSNKIWLSGNSKTPMAVHSQSDTDWDIAGVGDFNGDGKDDILWRNSNSGANVIWKSANSSSAQAVSAVTDTNFVVAGVADFNGDHRADILWHNTVTGSNSIWRSGSSSTKQGINKVTNTDWIVAACADFDGDGRADVFWRNSTTGASVMWMSAFKSLRKVGRSVSTPYNVAGYGDFNGDHKADLLWRNQSSGYNTIWKSANGATKQAVSTVSSAWVVGA
jgi:hypothetical protein